MTKKDYIAIADLLANRFSRVDKWQHGSEKMASITEIITISEDMIKLFAKDNPKFDKIKFIEYINNKRVDDNWKLVL